MTDVTNDFPSASTVTCGSVSYFRRKRTEYTLTSAIENAPFITPAVVIRVGPEPATLSAVEEALKSVVDDVYIPEEFDLHAVPILVYETAEAPQVQDEAAEYLLGRFWGKFLLQKIEQGKHWLEGPYFVQGRELHQAWRLYPDYLNAFTSSMVPSERGEYSFEPLKAMAYNGLQSVVAVPSRLHFPVSDEKPLNGLRISVKDNFHVEGMVTTLGSRSFARLNGIQSETSAHLKSLIDLGAIIVGKTKLSSFAGTELPPAGCIDFPAPFNPRGDGYQNPMGSSSGGAAAVAGYQWLDASITTDTTGSTRAPAAICGVWALRATWDSLPMDGIVPSVKTFDAVGLMSRAPEVLQKLLRPSISKTSQNASVRIIYPTDWLPTKNQKQQDMLEALTSSLEKSLGITRDEISLVDHWVKTAPESVRDIKLPDYLRKTGYSINMYDGYHNFAEFREHFAETYKEPPYISPVQTKKWQSGSQVTLDQRRDAAEQVSVLKEWVFNHVFESNALNIVIVPVGSTSPNYRDEAPPPPAAPGPGGSYNPNFIPTLLGLPQVLVPIGQLPYQSRVTDRTEYIPVVAGLIGTPGGDNALIEVAKDALSKSEWPTEVLAGRFTFTVGDNDRNAVPQPPPPKL